MAKHKPGAPFLFVVPRLLAEDEVAPPMVRYLQVSGYGAAQFVHQRKQITTNSMFGNLNDLQ